VSPDLLRLGGALVVALALAWWLDWRRRRAPKYLVTLEKSTNINEQPERVVIQANYPTSISRADLWLEIEKMGLVATSRMTSINQDILDAVAEETAEITRKREEKRRLEDEFKTEKTKLRLARQLGVPVEQVTDEQLREAQARALPKVRAG
jgi:hypothetical protein